jgi:hypothetical protein
MQGPAPATPEQVAEELRRIFAGSEFRSESSLFGEMLGWLMERLSPRGVVDATEVAGWVLLGLFGLLLALAFVQLVRSGLLRSSGSGPASASGALDPLERIRALLLEAAAARGAGDLKRALRLYFFALLVGLGESGGLRYDDAWTNRELLRRGRPEPRVRELLEPLVGELEGKEFGREPVRDQDVEELRALCERHLGALGRSTS